MFHWICQLLNHVIIIKNNGSSTSGIGDISRFRLSSLDRLVFLLQNTFQFLGSQIVWL